MASPGRIANVREAFVEGTLSAVGRPSPRDGQCPLSGSGTPSAPPPQHTFRMAADGSGCYPAGLTIFVKYSEATVRLPPMPRTELEEALAEHPGIGTERREAKQYVESLPALRSVLVPSDRKNARIGLLALAGCCGALLCMLLGHARADEAAIRYVQFVEEQTAICVTRNGVQSPREEQASDLQAAGLARPLPHGCWKRRPLAIGVGAGRRS
jgi:hypothetical protein